MTTPEENIPDAKYLVQCKYKTFPNGGVETVFTIQTYKPLSEGFNKKLIEILNEEVE